MGRLHEVPAAWRTEPSFRFKLQYRCVAAG